MEEVMMVRSGRIGVCKALGVPEHLTYEQIIDVINGWIVHDKEMKKRAIQELLEQHKKDRAKVSSKSDLINMSTVEKYLEGL
ncbi:hypothetical protein pA_gene0027 [Vibrio phage 13VT501A]|nr:hypothetical protein pA_gene0027 [Vibrio phage 13VT501A]